MRGSLRAEGVLRDRLCFGRVVPAADDRPRFGRALLPLVAKRISRSEGDLGTYPNNLGHEDDPGCFRCHDGEHATTDATVSIGQDCTSCHEPIAVEEPDPEILKTLQISG